MVGGGVNTHSARKRGGGERKRRGGGEREIESACVCVCMCKRMEGKRSRRI